jgi:thymidylate kinase
MFVTLEGHSYSGKTTLFKYLKEHLRMHPIAEHDVYADGIDKYPPFPATNEQMAKDSIDFFAGLEAKRYGDAQNAKQRTVLYDRSFISVVLFQKYMKYLAIPGHYNAYEYAKDKFLHLLNSNEIALPDYFAFVRCDNIETYMQRQNREISVGFLKGEEALKFFEHEYTQVFNLYDKFDRAVELRTADTNTSLINNSRLLEAVLDGTSEFDMSARNVITKRLMEII